MVILDNVRIFCSGGRSRKTVLETIKEGYKGNTIVIRTLPLAPSTLRGYRMFHLLNVCQSLPICYI